MTTEEQLKKALAEIEMLKKTVEQKTATIAKLESELEYLRKKIFGKMSEKHLPLDPNQIYLFDLEYMTDEERAFLAQAAEESEKTITKTVTVTKKPARRDLDMEKLPVREEHIYPDGVLDENGVLLPDYVEIGTDERKVIERVPASVYVLKTINHKIISKVDIATKAPEERTILSKGLPLAPISKCMAGASVLTDIVIGKFMYHLPYYRQIQQYKEAGITISDSTMGGWFEETIDKLLPLYITQKKKILRSMYVQVDESVVPVVDNEKHKTKKGYMWCLRDAITGDVIFHYDQGSRAARVASQLLGDYEGIIQTDGYEGYNQFEGKVGITTCGCWAHVRRKFVDALKENEKLATEAILLIGKLYEVESQADSENLTAAQRAELRKDKSYKIILTLEHWLEENYLKVLPNSRLGKAISYTYGLLPRLRNYVYHGEVNIDNNLIENAIRPLALGRKNYLFCGNDAAAMRAAIAYSLIGTCKAADVDPREWMTDVLNNLPYYEKEGKDIAELLPGAWAESNKLS